MLKRMCDICGKEIDSIDTVYSIGIYSIDEDYGATKYEDVCVNCANDVKNLIYKIRLNKGGD